MYSCYEVLLLVGFQISLPWKSQQLLRYNTPESASTILSGPGSCWLHFNYLEVPICDQIGYLAVHCCVKFSELLQFPALFFVLLLCIHINQTGSLQSPSFITVVRIRIYSVRAAYDPCSHSIDQISTFVRIPPLSWILL